MTKEANIVVPVVTLSNGIRVANFSSPHSFTFVDGTVLPACSEGRARELMLDCVETEFKNSTTTVQYIDIHLKWELSEMVRKELIRLVESQDFDILLVPLPVMQALKASYLPIGRCRCIRVADRITKAVHIDRFCI